MHLLAAQPGGFTDDEGIIDLQQSPADIVVLSAADSSLTALASSIESLPEEFPSIRLANWMQLLKPAAFDLYQDKVLDHATIVVVSLLGGKSYWQYGFDRLVAWSKGMTNNNARQLILVPGDDVVDQELLLATTVEHDIATLIWRYLREGGSSNLAQLFYCLSDQIGRASCRERV